MRIELFNRHPVICLIQAWAEDPEVYNDQSNNDNGHYVVAVGYGTYVTNNSHKNFFIFMDPSTSGSYTYINEDDFVKRWHDKDEEENEEYNYFGILVKYNDIEPSGDEIERFYPLG